MEDNEKNNLTDNKGEIDLLELFNLLWKGKNKIILITSIVAILGLIYSFSITNLYRSEAILTQIDQKNNSGFGKYSDLASFTGINLSSNLDRGVEEVIEIIQSREFIRNLINKENITPSLMAAESFDFESKKLTYNSDNYDEKSKKWNVKKYASQKGPSYLEVHEFYIDKVFSISRNKANGFITIGIQHVSPIFARDFLALIIFEANKIKREKDIEKSNKSLDYLKKELTKTSLIQIKESINHLIASKLEIQMNARIDEEYALVMIDPPFVPERKYSPNRLFILIVSIFIGLFTGIIMVIANYKKQ